MDLQKQITLTAKPLGGGPSSTTQVSLFEAVRRWTEDDGVSLEIHDGDRVLTRDEILQIAHTDAFERLLFAYNERR